MSLELLHSAVSGAPMTRRQASDLLRAFGDGLVGPEVLSAALTALRIRGETSEVLIGFVEVLRERLLPVDLGDCAAVDLCGTGGDGQCTRNLSTAAAFVVAGAGVPVAKHGNHGVSSRTGSADVLKALGIGLRQAPETLVNCIRNEGLGFIYAPAHHPLFAKIGPVRRTLGFRTAFNLLGPVVNPAGVQRQVIGTFSLEAMHTLAAVLAGLGTERSMVVHTPGPYDEVSLTAPAQAILVEGGATRELCLPPEAFGARTLDPAELKGGDAVENAQAIVALLQGAPGGFREAVCANAACVLHIAGKTKDLREGFQLAAHAIDSGAALARLVTLRQTCPEVGA